jgi:hypothetical protein
MSLIKCLASISLAATTLPTLHAESHCPGNVASLPFHVVQRSKIIVPVVINHTGPYEFLVDTGTGSTIVDPLLATELHLETRGSTELVGVAYSMHGSLANVEMLEAGPHSVANHPVVVQDLQYLREGDLHSRGTIGGDFLGHFDVLIDYTHRILCLDDTKVMRAAVKGGHVPLVTSPHTPDEVPFAALVIIPVHLSGFAPRQLLLTLDSGANASFLFNHILRLAPGLLENGQKGVYGINGVKRWMSFLPPQSLQIGSFTIEQVSFAVPADSRENALIAKEDGLLSTGLFRRVFISYADRFVVLEPW